MKVIEVALQAGRKRQSAQTGFVHETDAIPLLENACFALALFRSRLSENVLEGKALLERILAFFQGSFFPTYLHEYPEIKDKAITAHMLAPLSWIHADFGGVLGEKLKLKLEECLAKSSCALALEPLSKGASLKVDAFLGRFEPSSFTPSSPEQWGDFLIAQQMLPTSHGMDLAAAEWHLGSMAYVGKQKQERGEPALTLYDLFMGAHVGAFSRRMLQDHPIHVQAALIRPPCAQASPFASKALSTSPSHFFLVWGEAHTLVCFQALGALEEGFLITLPEEIPEEDKSVEIKLFCSIHKDLSLFVNGKKGSTFALGDTLDIVSKETTIRIVFSLEKGEGVFFGHISLGNRPMQLCKQDAYDWQIGLRTLRRSASAALRVHVQTIA